MAVFQQRPPCRQLSVVIVLIHRVYDVAVLKAIFNFYLGPPPPPGGPGEGPDCHLPEEIVVFGSIPARIRG